MKVLRRAELARRSNPHRHSSGKFIPASPPAAELKNHPQVFDLLPSRFKQML